ncbi:MAG: hypothetical protein ACI8RD_000935 [Bacillariaceae sp.]|jgi:hypothetical protein
MENAKQKRDTHHGWNPPPPSCECNRGRDDVAPAKIGGEDVGKDNLYEAMVTIIH